MKSFNFKKLIGVSALGLVAVLGMTESAIAQAWRNNQKQERKIEKQQEKLQEQRAKLEQQRLRLQQQGNNQNVYANNNNRYRVYRNGAYYNIDNRQHPRNDPESGT